MKNLKQKALALVLMLVLVLAVVACGGGSGSFSGTFVEEGWEDSGMSMVFNNNNTFSMVMELGAIGFGFLADGDISLDGRYTVDEDAQVINLTINERAARDFANALLDIITEGLQNDPEFANDPAGAEMLEMMLEMFEEEIDAMAEEMLAEIEEMYIRFDGNFDRLYMNDGTVFIRR